MKLSEIAKQLGISEKSLKRILSIERNLTDSMEINIHCQKKRFLLCKIQMNQKHRKNLQNLMEYVHTYDLGYSNASKALNDHVDKEDKLNNVSLSSLGQRGDVGGSAKKVGLRIKELERIYGIEHGGDRTQHEKNSSCKTQSGLAYDMNMDVRTLQNYKQLANMIPELDELVTTGIVTKTTALAIMRNLSEKDQEEFIESIPIDKKYTQKQMDEEIQKYKN